MSSQCSVELLKSALAGELPPEREEILHRHLDECEACVAALEHMAGGEAGCREAAALLTSDEIDRAVPSREEWSDVDFTVEHLEPSDEPNVLGRLGGYDVLEIIGRGGMGVVLKGYDRELKRCVAIKMLAPHLAQSSLAKKRFAREAQAAAAVVHPNVLAIHQVQPNGPLPFLVMPLLAGESLAQRLAAQGRLELKEILRVGLQAAAGLAAAHEQGLVHRDVKPANILLEKGVERAVLTDFGLARAADDVSMTRWGVIAGTPQYMSPEQARGEPLDGRSDLFSLGCVLYEMATGVSPFRADSTMATLRRLIDDAPPAMASLNPELPTWFVGIVNRLLEKDPAQRLGSAKEVSELLEGCLAHLQQPTSVPLPASLSVSAARDVLKPRKTHGRGIIAIAATLGIALLGMLVMQSTEPPDIAGQWSSDGVGQIVLTQTAVGEYEGTYGSAIGNVPCKIQLKWSRLQRRFSGTWRESSDCFGEISLRLVGQEIRGARTADPKSKIGSATPRLTDFTWTRSETAPNPSQATKAAALESVSQIDTAKGATVYDLKNDWSDKANPNGVWSYNAGANPLPHQDKLGLPYPVSDGQPGWGPSDRSEPPSSSRLLLPIWFKAVQSHPSDSYGNTEDWEAGDVVTHTQNDENGQSEGKSNVTFTFPGAKPGFANISGSVWMARHIGRSVKWALYHNSTLLTKGSVHSVEPYNRDKPFNLADGSRGPCAVVNVPLQPGDVIKLVFTPRIDPAREVGGDFMGVNLRITTAPEPFPAKAAAIYDPVADYDAGWKVGKNPNGVWTYGWSSTPTSSLHLYTRKADQKDYQPNTNFAGWNDPSELSLTSPTIYRNLGKEYVTNHVDIPSGALILHGGGPSGNDFSHLVWTAPREGSFSLDATFTLRQVPTSGWSPSHPTNVYILMNGKPFFEGHLKFYGEKCSDNVVFPLSAGDTIDFAVGFPGNRLYGQATQLEANITDVSEPVARLSPKKHVRALAKYFDGVKIAEPIVYRQLSVYPILAAGAPALPGRWLTLDKAISRGILDVRERPDRSIDMVQVQNHSPDENVLMMYGEVIAGGMRTRAVRQDVVLAPGQKIDLPVFSVELNSRVGEEKFSAGSKNMLPQSILGELRRCSVDQNRVYSEVARIDLSLDAENASEDLDVALNSTHVRKKLEDVRRRIVPQIPRGAVGFIFVDHDCAVGADFFGSADLARELLPKILDSYVVDYVLPSGSDSGREAKRDRHVAIDFLERICGAGSQLATPLGSGDGICARQRGLMGGLMGDGVSMDDAPVHYGVQLDKRIEPKPAQRP